MKIKEMKYTGISQREVLADEFFHGFRLAVFSLGSHPTAYVMIPDESPLLDQGFNPSEIECHGGITYYDKGLPILDGRAAHFWIGWDYTHAGDYTKYENGFETGTRMYSTQEMLNEARFVAGQLAGLAIMASSKEGA